MSTRIEAMRSALQRELLPERLEIEDQSAQHTGHAGVRGHGGGHFSVHIVADCFAGKSRIARHRMVHAALGDDVFRDSIHALSIRAQSLEDAAD